jgi:PIF1-like helicase
LSVEEVIEKECLNVEQARAFSIIANHSLMDNVKPLRMYLGGPGGTGKSRVINGLRDFFKSRGQHRRFRLASYTGVAARNITGMTLHAALKLGGQYRNAKSAKAKQELMSMWEGVDYLFIDEISMVGCALLNDISHALSVAKGNDLAFGGINVVFAGDFAQLPLVGQVRLYSHIDQKAISKAATTSGQKVVFGKLLWLSVNTVVMLTENMRQAGEYNRPFKELLERLREGRCTDADYVLLNSRVARNLEIDWDSDGWSTAPVIVAENKMKDALNVRMAHEFAARTGQPLHWYYSVDTHAKSTPIENEDVKAKLYDLDSGKTNSRLGKIPLVIGMPVMIAQNFDVSGGVVNGCTGKLVKVRYRVGEDGNRHALSCVVEAPDTASGIMPDLPNHHVVSLRDTVDITFKHPHSGATVLVKRAQVPVLPAFVITAHKAQGKTLAYCVVNFTGCRGTESPYVMVSRATSLEGLVILTPFSKSKICCRQSEDTRKEFLRLKLLALETVVRHGTADEVVVAKQKLDTLYGKSRRLPDVDDPVVGDAATRVVQLQRRNALVDDAVTERLVRKDVDTPISNPPASSVISLPVSSGSGRRLAKRGLDDASVLSPDVVPKRRRLRRQEQR